MATDHKSTRVAVQVQLGFGSRDDPQTSPGMAHLVEHLLFGQARDLEQGEYARTIAVLGGRFAASTGYEHLALSSEVPSESLDLLLWMEADRLFTVAEKVTQLAIEKEADVIDNERALRLSSDPFGGWFSVALALLRGADSPYGRPPVGDPAAIRNLTPRMVAEFIDNKIYSSSIVVAIAGAVDEGRALEATNYYFGDAHAVETAWYPAREPIWLRKNIYLPLRGGSAFRVLFNIPSASDPRFTAVHLASQAMATDLQQRASLAGSNVSVRLQIRPLRDEDSLGSISLTSPEPGISFRFAELFYEAWSQIERHDLSTDLWTQALETLFREYNDSLRELGERAAVMARNGFGKDGTGMRGDRLTQLSLASAQDLACAWFVSGSHIVVLPSKT
ncbi:MULTISPECIES: insulinase family protein [Cryobacterium]|uniref:M16 family metallopeptidase n=1 Tax=Cryobacterium TaxID=69578 RepID=UPI00141ABCED|nr:MULTISPECIES: insulinase family protein [Cryobacterium]